MSDIHVQIGTHKIDYDLYTTTAPEEYDSASTITVHRDGDHHRYVLIDVRMIEWHRGRYASGMYRFESEPVDQSMLSYVSGKLLDRLRQQGGWQHHE